MNDICVQSRFAHTDEEAQERYNRFKHKDPFSSIHTALLNSADVEDYVSATGLIFPFDLQRMKPASYEVVLDGMIYCWDGNGNNCSKLIVNKGDSFILEKNSIAFVSLNVKFRIPDYLALRFNLAITQVHRGLLLGTGPLVDPGFEGNLLIPLHNLTVNDYELKWGEVFICVEFTKLSTNKRWSGLGSLNQNGVYVEFPKDKKNKDAKHYLGSAALSEKIRSSIPEAIKLSEESALKAAKSAEDAAKKARWNFIGLLIGAIGVIVALAIGTPQVLAIIAQNTTAINNSNIGLNENKKLKEELHDLQKKYEILQQEIRRRNHHD